MFSRLNYSFEKISEDEASLFDGRIYFLHELDPLKSRGSFSLSHPSLFFLEKEDLSLLLLQEAPDDLPEWIIKKINSRNIQAINTQYPQWTNLINNAPSSKWKVNLVGTGDVGGILATGLHLLGESAISEIGLFGKDPNSTKRWEYEINQIVSPSKDTIFPKVNIIEESQLFNCDMFIFCASAGVPPVGQDKDVRMVQFEKNQKIISIYAKLARENKFKGIFAVVSDPVDLLCKAALISSNTDSSGNRDLLGLAPEQIRGYGLGVMHGRAVYYSQENSDALNYATEGRAYGPHGNGLVIANSIDNYNHDASLWLTEKTKKANLDVRSTGYKPFIAPALSSGALSILATIKGDWHYSATYMGGVYMGAKNKLNPTGIEIEQLSLPRELINRLDRTYKELSMII